MLAPEGTLEGLGLERIGVVDGVEEIEDQVLVAQSTFTVPFGSVGVLIMGEGMGLR